MILEWACPPSLQNTKQIKHHTNKTRNAQKGCLSWTSCLGTTSSQKCLYACHAWSLSRCKPQHLPIHTRRNHWPKGNKGKIFPPKCAHPILSCYSIGLGEIDQQTRNPEMNCDLRGPHGVPKCWKMRRERLLGQGLFRPLQSSFQPCFGESIGLPKPLEMFFQPWFGGGFKTTHMCN